MKRKFFSAAPVLLALAFGWFGCAKQQEGTPAQPEASITKAVAVLSPTAGNTASGVVTFTKEAGGVRVVANITGVPAGDHGFHVHEFGDCSAPDGTAAGGHFNPTGMSHAGPTAEQRHVGDLGNVTADDQGSVALDYVDTHLAFSGANSIIGRGLILHANPDDLASQPTGNAGGRIACGVIGVAK
jgi:Cu-Zn family superoxide dismutase